MSAKTKIEWTESTWNPIAGCSDVSEGCRNCYARGMAKRLAAMGSKKYNGLTVLQGSKTVWTGRISFDEKALLAPLRRNKPTRYFVNSMSDLFHSNVTDDMRDKIFAVMALCPQHTFQVLTKRPERMLTYLTSAPWGRIEEEAIAIACAFYDLPCMANIASDATDIDRIPLPNVQLRVSVEDQKAADQRLSHLCDLADQGWKTMVSFEPLLSAVDPGKRWLALGAKTWGIVGGESGRKARPMHPDWARGLRDHCVVAGVPFFFKQRGEYAPNPDDAHVDRVGKKTAGRLLDGREWNEMPA